METEIKQEVEDFKARILANLDKVDIAFEVSFCWKRCNETSWEDEYWTGCYYFLKGLADFYNVKSV